MGNLETLEQWLNEQQDDLVSITDKLISEDAPKNKFSIVTGKRLMIELIRQKIDAIRRTEP